MRRPPSTRPATTANRCAHPTVAQASARRWTEIDLGWLASSETLLPPRADGSPERRVPVLVIEEVKGWRSTKFFTFYPALAPFLDIPSTHIAGASVAMPGGPLPPPPPPLPAPYMCAPLRFQAA